MEIERDREMPDWKSWVVAGIVLVLLSIFLPRDAAIIVLWIAVLFLGWQLWTHQVELNKYYERDAKLQDEMKKRDDDPKS